MIRFFYKILDYIPAHNITNNQLEDVILLPPFHPLFLEARAYTSTKVICGGWNFYILPKKQLEVRARYWSHRSKHLFLLGSFYLGEGNYQCLYLTDNPNEKLFTRRET
jgi:hypothetical protein